MTAVCRLNRARYADSFVFNGAQPACLFMDGQREWQFRLRTVARMGWKGVLFMMITANTCITSLCAEDGISVEGSGRATAKPDLVEMGGTVIGDAELAEDAMTKFRNNRRRTVGAIEALKIEGLTIVGGGMSIASGEMNQQMQMIFGGGNPQQVPAKVTVSEPLTFRMTGIDAADADQLFATIIKIVDAGKDTGIVVRAKPMSVIQMQMEQGQMPALATYKSSNIDDLKQQAYEKAIQNARANADRLAKLAEVKLGKVVSIQDLSVPNQNEANFNIYAAYGINPSKPEEDDYSSNTSSEIIVEVKLNVRFAIE
ncbi:MAG: SIMPL domain-containing protein [Planctomycetaceae bacterium]